MRVFFKKRGPLFEFAQWELCIPSERFEPGMLLLTVVNVPHEADELAMLEQMLIKNPGDQVLTYKELMNEYATV